ncbi:hypothetical protein FGRMN_4137 [Fusarium graminum]|nr:hypothetical protein FGRMN_4137 [Fusarium graminum]
MSRPWPIALAFLSLLALSSAEEFIWSDQAWVPTRPCGKVDPHFPTEASPFWIGPFVGMWDVEGDAAELELHILAAHNTSLITCDEVDVSLLERSTAFEVLGYHVGRKERFWSTCPLPNTERLSSDKDDIRFCSYHMVFSFSSAHRLQALESTFQFHRKNGEYLDCAIAMITPDMGAPISNAFTFTPLSILVLLTVSSWQRHQKELSYNYVFQHGSAIAGPLWPTVLDVTGYLRYLQFAFITASMSLKYPGFYVPAVGKLAWANLIFWQGALDGRYFYQGPTGGMYPSNASYGLNFMTQMIGYPDTLDQPTNPLINTLILMSPILILLSISFWILSRPSPVQPSPLAIGKKAAVTTTGIALCLLSVPLVTFISFELILVGYLPNYRIALAVLMLAIIIGASHFLLRILDGHSENRSNNEPGDPNAPIVDVGAIRKALLRHIAYSMPLIQAIGVGSLQDFPSVQLVFVMACECVLLVFHIDSGKEKQLITSQTVYISLVRLISLVPMIVFILPTTTAIKQWAGYVILVLHGLVIFLGFTARSIWNLYKTFYKPRDVGRKRSANAAGEGLDSTTAFQMQNVSSYFSSNMFDYRRTHSREPSWQGYQQDPSSFTRPPRSPITITSFELPEPFVAHRSVSVTVDSEKPPRETKFDMNKVLSEVSPEPHVDYSFREGDRFYGVTEQRTFITSASTLDVTAASGPSLSEPREDGGGRLTPKRFVDGLTRTFELSRSKPIEKGFEVRRPPRPPPP